MNILARKRSTMYIERTVLIRQILNYMHGDKIYMCTQGMPVKDEMCDDQLLHICPDHGQPVACLLEEHLLVE